MEKLDLVSVTGYILIVLVLYRFFLNSISMILNFIARRTENKLDDAIARLLNRMARLSKSTIDLIK